MTKCIEKNTENIFKCRNKEDMLSFVKAVEDDNHNEISSMIHNDFETLFELENLLLELQKALNKQECYQDDNVLINDNIDEIKTVIQKIKFKLLTIDKQKQKHQLMIDDCFSDTKLVCHVISSNFDDNTVIEDIKQLQNELLSKEILVNKQLHDELIVLAEIIFKKIKELI